MNRRKPEHRTGSGQRNFKARPFSGGSRFTRDARRLFPFV
jgi:hypothetical protein